MQRMTEILHEINNADQIVMGIRESIEEKKKFDFDGLVEMQTSLERAIKLFGIANGKISDAIINELDEINNDLDKLIIGEGK